MNTISLIPLLSRLQAQMARRLAAGLATKDLGLLAPAHVDLLLQLAQEDMTMKRLALAIGRDKSTLTPLIEKLIHWGYVIRLQDGQDKRVYNVSITQQGLKLIPKLKALLASLEEDHTRLLSPSENALLIKLLDKLNQS